MTARSHGLAPGKGRKEYFRTNKRLQGTAVGGVGGIIGQASATRPTCTLGLGSLWLLQDAVDIEREILGQDWNMSQNAKNFADRPAGAVDGQPNHV